MKKIIEEIQEGLMEGDAQFIKAKTEDALMRGVKAEYIIQEALMPAMKVIGQKFRDGQLFIPDVLMSSRAMHASLYVLRPLLSSARLAIKGTVLIGTVAGDLHDIGKNMVIMMLQGAGYSVIDLGIDVPANEFVKSVRTHKPDVLAMSALLTTTLEDLKDVVSQLKEEGLRHEVKILVGGGPVTPEFAMAIDSDAYAADAFHAIEATDRLMSGEVGFFTVP